MADIEKVTNLIRELQRYEPQCTDYFKDVIDAVIELLKEQEPVKPIDQGDDSYVYDNCGETVGWEELDAYGIDPVKYNYCPGCGRKVKWDD